jgi:hypothetical protein
MARKCWAAALGGCSTKMSNEHVITEGAFTSRELRIGGAVRLPQDRGLSRANVKAKVLCATHNSRLSDLDDEAIRLAAAMRTYMRVSEPGDMRVRVNGWKIERWCLKTGCSLLASRWMAPRDFSPDPAMIRMVFGERNLPPGAGLYLVKEPALDLQSDTDTARWNLLFERDDPSSIKSLYIAIHGLGLFVGPSDSLSKLHDSGDPDWGKAQLMYRPASIQISTRLPQWPENTTAQMTIEFTW